MIERFKESIVICLLFIQIFPFAFGEDRSEESMSECLRYPCQKVFWITRDGEFKVQYRRKAAASGIPNNVLGSGIVISLYPNRIFDFDSNQFLRSGKVTGIAVEINSIFLSGFAASDNAAMLQKFVSEVSKLTGLKSLVFRCMIPREVNLSPLSKLVGLQCLSVGPHCYAKCNFISDLKQLIWLECIAQGIDYVGGEQWHLETLKYLNVAYNGNSENCDKISLGDTERFLHVKATIGSGRLDKNSFDWLPAWAKLSELAIEHSKIEKDVLGIGCLGQVEKLHVSDIQGETNIAEIIYKVNTTVVSVKMRNILTQESIFDALSSCKKLKDLEMTAIGSHGILSSKCKLERLVIDSTCYKSIDISACSELKSLDVGNIDDIGIFDDFLSLPSLENVNALVSSSTIARNVLTLLVNPQSVTLSIYPFDPNDIMGPPSDNYGEGYNNLDYPAEYDGNLMRDMTKFEKLKYLAVTYLHPIREKEYSRCLSTADKSVCRTLSERCDAIVLDNVPFDWSACCILPNKTYVNRRFGASQLPMMRDLARRDIMTEPSVQECEIYKDKIAEDTGKMCANLYRMRLASGKPMWSGSEQEYRDEYGGVSICIPRSICRDILRVLICETRIGKDEENNRYAFIYPSACKIGDRLVIVKLTEGTLVWAEVDNAIRDKIQEYSKQH